jgi:hypothetical protein
MTPDYRHKDGGLKSSEMKLFLTEFFSGQLGIIYQF